MKKKLLAMLLAVVMVCGVAGCGKDKTDTTDGQQVTAELDGKMKKEADTLQIRLRHRSRPRGRRLHRRCC